MVRNFLSFLKNTAHYFYEIKLFKNIYTVLVIFPFTYVYIILLKSRFTYYFLNVHSSNSKYIYLKCFLHCVLRIICTIYNEFLIFCLLVYFIFFK